MAAHRVTAPVKLPHHARRGDVKTRPDADELDSCLPIRLPERLQDVDWTLPGVSRLSAPPST